MTDAVPVMLNQVSTPAGVTEGWTAGGVRKCEVAAAVRFRGCRARMGRQMGALRRDMSSRPPLPCGESRTAADASRSGVRGRLTVCRERDVGRLASRVYGRQDAGAG